MLKKILFKTQPLLILERNILLCFVILVFAIDGSAVFRSQFNGLLHVVHRTLLVAFGQFYASAFMIGLGEIWVDFDCFIIYLKGFLQFVLEQIVVSFQEVSLLVERIERKYLIDQFQSVFLFPVFFRLYPAQVLLHRLKLHLF